MKFRKLNRKLNRYKGCQINGTYFQIFEATSTTNLKGGLSFLLKKNKKHRIFNKMTSRKEERLRYV